MVIKADGLAAGKGVIIASTVEEADEAITNMLEGNAFGESGSSIMIEEYLEGLEISIHAFCDGETAVLFPSSKDHKRIFDGDKGPNTGGMGAVAPIDRVDEHSMRLIQDQIVLPTLRALAKRGRKFKGTLYPGVMLTKDGPKVIEFNARFGDPETQSYMRLLDSDLFDVLSACAHGALKNIEIRWRNVYACCIVLASQGYPESPKIGDRINGVYDDDTVVMFHAGTAAEGTDVMTAGGRVLGVTATGSTLRAALDAAYAAVEKVSFEGKQYRKDIGATLL